MYRVPRLRTQYEFQLSKKSGCSHDPECDLDEKCNPTTCQCEKLTCPYSAIFGGQIIPTIETEDLQLQKANVGSDAQLHCQRGYIYQPRDSQSPKRSSSVRLKCVNAMPAPKWVESEGGDEMGRCISGCLSDCDCESGVSQRCSPSKWSCSVQTCRNKDPNAVLIITPLTGSLMPHAGVATVECGLGTVMKLPDDKTVTSVRVACKPSIEGKCDFDVVKSGPKFAAVDYENATVPLCVPGCQTDDDCAEDEICTKATCTPS